MFRTGRSSGGTCTSLQSNAALHVDGDSEKVFYDDPGWQLSFHSCKSSWSGLSQKDSIISATGTLYACFLQIISPFLFLFARCCHTFWYVLWKHRDSFNSSQMSQLQTNGFIFFMQWHVHWHISFDEPLICWLCFGCHCSCNLSTSKVRRFWFIWVEPITPSNLVKNFIIIKQKFLVWMLMV